MRKKIIFWFVTIFMVMALMDALLIRGYEDAVALLIPVTLLCIVYKRISKKDPAFSVMLCLSTCVALFLSLIVGIIVEPHITNLLVRFVGKTYALTALFSIILYFFLGLFVDDERAEPVDISQVKWKELLNRSMCGYTEGDYRFPTDEDFKAISQDKASN